MWNLFKVSIKDSSKRWRDFGICVAEFAQIEHLALVTLFADYNLYAVFFNLLFRR